MDPLQCARVGDVDFFKKVELEVLQNATSNDEYGESVLAKVAGFGHLDCCEEIYKRCPSLLYKPNIKGATPLHGAAFHGKTEIVKFLIACAESEETGTGGVEKLLTMASNDGNTALHYATTRGHTEAAKVLIAADVNNKLLGMINNRDKDTAMHIAVKKHNYDLVKLLIDKDPNFDYHANGLGHTHTPLWLAYEEALTGDETAVKIRKMLLKKQPDQCKVRKGDEGWTLLHHAAVNGDLGTIEEIVRFCPECLELLDIMKAVVFFI